jgi:hypothetical protein
VGGALDSPHQFLPGVPPHSVHALRATITVISD